MTPATPSPLVCPYCGRPPLRKRCACRDGAAKRRRLPPPLVRLVAGLLAAGKLEVMA